MRGFIQLHLLPFGGCQQLLQTDSEVMSGVRHILGNLQQFFVHGARHWPLLVHDAAGLPQEVPDMLTQMRTDGAQHQGLDLNEAEDQILVHSVQFVLPVLISTSLWK